MILPHSPSQCLYIPPVVGLGGGWVAASLHAYACIGMHALVYACIYMHMHAYARICIHMHAYACTLIHMNAHACTCMLMHAYACMHAHARIQPPTPAHDEFGGV